MNILQKITAISVISTATLMAGCANNATTDTVSKTQYSNDLAKQEKLYLSKIENLKKQHTRELTSNTNNTPVPQVSDVSSQLFPPNAQPGRCYSRVLIPAQYKTSTEQVLTREATEQVSIKPAQYQWGQKQVLIKEASTKVIPVPARYEQVTEQVLIKPAYTESIAVPAQYETVKEQVLDKPAHTAWKRGNGFRSSALQTRIDNGTGEVMCLVEVPASYKTITRTVLKTPATTKTVEYPAQYDTVTKRIVVEEATTKTIEIPAEYATVKVRELVTKEQELRSTIPAQYETVSRSEKVEDEQLKWSEVLCEINMTRDTVAQFQQLLKQAGKYRGPVDGIYGSMTEKAANSYAKANGLPTGSRLISLETAEHIGLTL